MENEFKGKAVRLYAKSISVIAKLDETLSFSLIDLASSSRAAASSPDMDCRAVSADSYATQAF
eukprot:scaffold575_cov104-Cylindrotheca_fusiformis.AAC.2